MKRTPPYYMRRCFLLLLLFLCACRQPVLQQNINPLTGLPSELSPIETAVFPQPMKADVLVEVPADVGTVYLAISSSPLPTSALPAPSLCETLASGFHAIDSTLFIFQDLEPFEKESGTFQVGNRTFAYNNGLYEGCWTNIILLETDIFYDADLRWHMNIDGGTGYYFCNGTHQEIRWQKISADRPLALWDTNGTPLAVQPGRTFILFTQYDTFVDPEE